MDAQLAGPADPRDKEAWRALARRARTGVARDAWSRAVRAALRAWPVYREARTVASYLPFGSEADLAPLHGDGKRFAAPRTPARGRTLRFHALGGPLERHRFGMDEPRADAEVVDDDAFDLILVPGLAFDRFGGRIGYGGGYYDAWLATVPTQVPRVGIAHPALLAARLPHEPHDAPLSHLALPGGVVPCTPGRGAPLA
jgi:5-formyltetrahydrofolate cyclo-ligase